jgi:hypothetical protein
VLVDLRDGEIARAEHIANGEDRRIGKGLVEGQLYVAAFDPLAGLGISLDDVIGNVRREVGESTLVEGLEGSRDCSGELGIGWLLLALDDRAKGVWLE